MDVTAAAVLPLATETVVATLAGISTLPGGARVLLDGLVLIDAAVGSTTVTVRTRRTSLTGALVGEAAVVTMTGDITVLTAHHAEDTPGEVSGRTYVLTAEAAGAAASAEHAHLSAVVL